MPLCSLNLQLLRLATDSVPSTGGHITFRSPLNTLPRPVHPTPLSAPTVPYYPIPNSLHRAPPRPPILVQFPPCPRLVPVPFPSHSRLIPVPSPSQPHSYSYHAITNLSCPGPPRPMSPHSTMPRAMPSRPICYAGPTASCGASTVLGSPSRGSPSTPPRLPALAMSPR